MLYPSWIWCLNQLVILLQQVQMFTQDGEADLAAYSTPITSSWIESIENATKLKEQMESLASNLSSLNGVYGGMLSAMNKKS